MNTLTTTQRDTSVFKTEFVEVRYDRLRSLLIAEWKRQITFEERVAGYEAFYYYLKTTGAENILINNERIFLFTASEKCWLSNFLKANIENTNLKKFALVTSDVYKNMTDLSDYIEKQKNDRHLGRLEYEFFIDSDTARVWLCPNEDL